MAGNEERKAKSPNAGWNLPRAIHQPGSQRPKRLVNGAVLQTAPLKQGQLVNEDPPLAG